MNSISLSNVSKIYPEAKNHALIDINLEIKEGEFVSIVGPSGCGKSTVLKLIAKLESPSFGQVNSPDEISMVFQTGGLFPWLNVEENTSFGLKMKGVSKNEVDQMTEKMLSMVGLNNLYNRFPRELSGGQKQRVGVARALAISPKVLLLDEPFSSLDTMTVDELHLDLLKIWQSLKMTIVLVSHSLQEAVLLSDRVVVMKESKIEEILEVNLARPRNISQSHFLSMVEKIKHQLQS